MAQIDSSIYLQQQGIDFGKAMDGFERGRRMAQDTQESKLRMRSLTRSDAEAERQAGFKSAVRSSMVRDPVTGMNVVDPSKAEEISKAYPAEFNEQRKQELADQQTLAQQQLAKKEAARKMYASEVVPALLGSTDQASWDKAKEVLLKNGADPHEVPDAFDKAHRDQLLTKSMEAHDAIAYHKSEQEHAEKMRGHDLTHETNMARISETGELRNARMSQQQNLQDERIHANVVKKIASDPIMRGKITQYQNLSSALSNFENAEHPTAQSFDELQQAVRANLGIKGQSAVGEREHTTMNSLGLNASRWTQFLTGNPQDIEKNEGFAKHMKDLVKLERQNIEGQMNKRLNTLGAGHASMYKRRQDLRDDLLGAIDAAGGEVGTQPGQPTAGRTLPPEMRTGNQPAPAYHEMSDSELAALYQQRVKGANANAR